jgi:hypothetical protein
MTNYSTADELYDALMEQTNKQSGDSQCILHALRNNRWTGEEGTSERGVNMIHTKINIHYKNGTKVKIPSYLSRSQIDMKFSQWGQTEIDLHTQYLDDTPQDFTQAPLIQNCNDWIILLNNHNHKVKNFAVLDIDSKEELFKIYKNGFPVFECAFTLSVSKALPHYYITTTEMLGQHLGTKSGDIDIDLICNYVYEKKKSKLYGLKPLEFTQKQLCDFCGFDKDKMVMRTPFSERKEDCIKKIHEKPAGIRDEYFIELGSKRFKPTKEVIPYNLLTKIFSVLPVENYINRTKWFSLVRATIAQLDTQSNANDYLLMVNDFFRKASKYEYDWDDENLSLFVKFINDNSYASLDANWFFRELKEVDMDLYKECIFAPHRPLDTKAFSKLRWSEALKFFNARVAFIDVSNQFVEYKHSTKQFVFRKEQDLKVAYRNLNYTGIKRVIKNDEVEEKEIKKKFINDWLDSEDRRTYAGGCCFKPPPSQPHYTHYNLFTGFDLDLDENPCENWSKDKLERELSVVFRHLRFLSGEDKTEEVFRYQMKYFASLLKYPGVLPRVALVWISVPGVGKNQFLNFLESIMGSKYYYSSSSSNEMLGDFNDCVRGKLLLNFNEFKSSSNNLEAIKELITEVTLSTREKHKNPIRIENFAHSVFASNQIGKRPIEIEYGDRRLVVIRNNPTPASDHYKFDLEYGKVLHETFTNKTIQYAFLTYCRKFVPVSKNYNFETNRPITEEYIQLRSRNIPYIIRFIKFWYATNPPQEEFTQGQLFGLFKDFKIQENEKIDIPSTYFINDIKNYVIRQTDEDYLDSNPTSIINMPKGKKQNMFRLDRLRTKLYLEKEHIDTSLFLNDTDDEDDEDEDE